MAGKGMNANDRKILSALNTGITKREELVNTTGLSEMQVRRSLEKLISSDYRLVKRIRKGHYQLTERGRKRQEEEKAKSDKMLHIGEDFLGKTNSYLKNKVPIAFQSVIRLILCEMHSRQSREIFDNPVHSGGYSSVILAGDPKTMKSPIIEAICRMTGLNFEEHKFVVGATKRETIGGWENLPGKGQTFIPSPWVNKRIIILDDFGDIIKRRDTREGVLILAHGDRSLRRGEQIIPQHCVPFITFNTRTKTISENIEEIETILGAEYVKRGLVVNVNSFAASLEDAPILTRKMLKSVPRLNLNAFPIRKTELTDEEFEFMYNIFKKATIPERRKLFDERSIGRRILSRYAFSKNENIIDSIFQTCIDELWRLQTLNITVENWRSELIKNWKEARPEDLKLKRIWEEEEKRIEKTKEKETEEQKKSLEEIEREKDSKLNEEATFNAEYVRELDKLKKLLLDSKGIPDFINRRSSLNKEYQGFKKGNLKEKFNQLKRRVPYWEEELEPHKIKYKEGQERIEKEIEERQSIIKELRNLKADLYSLTGCDSEDGLWRNRTSNLRSDIKGVTEQNKRLSLNHLRRFCAETRLKKVKFFFSREIEQLKKKLSPFVEKREQEAMQEIRNLDKCLLLWIKDTDSIEAIERVKEDDLPDITQDVDKLVISLKEKIRQKEEAEQRYAELEAIVTKKRLAIEKEKRKLSEKFKKPLSWKDYDDVERLERNKIKSYLDRKTFNKKALNNIVELAANYLRKWNIVNDQNLIDFRSFGKTNILKDLENPEKSIDVMPFKEVLIARLKQMEEEKKEKFRKQWKLLDEEERNLQPPLFYIITDKGFIRARNYLGEKEDQMLHFKFEDDKTWLLTKEGKWIVHTKIEYGGKLLPFISKKESTIVVQTNEGEREISKNQIFCYIYRYKGHEPIEEERWKREKLDEARKRYKEKQKTELNEVKKRIDKIKAITSEFTEEKEGKPQATAEPKEEISRISSVVPTTSPPQTTVPSEKPIVRGVNESELGSEPKTTPGHQNYYEGQKVWIMDEGIDTYTIQYEDGKETTVSKEKVIQVK